MSASPYSTEQHSFSQPGFPHGAGPGWYGSKIDLSFRKPISPRDVYWRQFLQIYHDVCRTTRAPLPSLSLRTEAPISSQEDVALADELVVEAAGKIVRSKSLWTRTPKSTESRDYRVATAALLRLVQEGGRPGVARSLVRRGGIITLSKDPQKQARQIAERHELIISAAKLQRESLVDYFATISPPERIAEAFAIAFESGNVELVRILLQRGASPDSLFQSIPNHSSLLDTAMLELLLQAPTPVSNATRERWLNAAVVQGKMDAAILLLQYGPGPSCQYLDLLHKAIDELHIEAFLLGLKTMHGSGGMQFDGLLPHIVKCSDMSFANKTIALEATLCVANSKEARTLHQRLRVLSPLDKDASEALHICSSSGQIGLIDVLRDSRFNTHVLSSTLISAITACDLYLLDHLYPPSSPATLPNGFSLSTLPNIKDNPTREKLLSRVLHLQIRGAYVDKELPRAILEKNMDTIVLLLLAGASADFNNGQSLALAVRAQHVKLVQALLPRTNEETRKAVFPHLRAADKLSRRLFTKLFIDSGIRGDVLHAAFREAVCDCTAFRDDELINILLQHGADFRQVIPASVHGLIDQGDTGALADLLNRMTTSNMPLHLISEFASRLLEYLMHLARTATNHQPRYEMIRIFIKSFAAGESVLSAFEEFLGTTTLSDEHLLVLFMSPTPQNRTTSYSAVIARVLNSIHIEILPRLIHEIELYDESLILALQYAACSALSDDVGTAERVRCLLRRPECSEPILESGLDFHVRLYTKECSSQQDWPLKTISALISKGFAGTIWLTHALMAIVEIDKPEVLSMVLKAAQQACPKDTIDSVLILAIQQNPARGTQSLKVLLDFGASQNGLDTALLMSSGTGNVQRCEALLEYGADVNSRSGECLTAALRQNRHSVVELLLATRTTTDASLSGAWCFVTAAASDIEASRKATYCKYILRAGFRGREVQECLMNNLARPDPDQDIITAILEESETLKQEKVLIGSHATASVTESSPVAEEYFNLIAALTRVVEVGNEGLCRLILTHLPTNFHIPIEIFKTATTTSVSILALLCERLPGTDKEGILDLCLIHAASLAVDPGTCTYLLNEGASCEAEEYGAISAATKRALVHNDSGSAHLDALVSFCPSQNALKVAWEIALESYQAGAESAHESPGPLRALTVLQIILSVGLQDLDAFKSCMYMLCNQPISQASKCADCAQNTFSRASDCCSFQRNKAKVILLTKSLLEHGLDADHSNGRCIVAAANTYQHEILDILLPRINDVATGSAKWFLNRDDCGIFFQNASQTTEQREQRLKSIQTLLTHGALCPALEDALLAAVQESIENAEARETAEMLLQCGVDETSGTALQFLAHQAQPTARQLISLLLERESSDDAKLRAIPILITSGLDEETTISLILLALVDPSSQLRDMSMEEKNHILQATAKANKSETLIFILSCVPGESSTQANSAFVTWLLRSCAELTECFFLAVLGWLGPEETRNIDVCSDGLCLVQEAILAGKTHFIPLLIDSGAASTKGGESMLYYLVENTEGENPELLIAITKLCNESTLDDGSLHLAVQSMREDVVNLLLEQGHDPNFGIRFEESSEDYRLPLNMLCATIPAVAYGLDGGNTFKGIVNNLLVHGADISGLMCGRSPLLNALDNPGCTVTLVKDIVECLRFSEELDQSLIENDTNYSADLEPAISSDSGTHLDAGDPQGSQSDAIDISTRACASAPGTNPTRYMCPMDGCKITRERKSNLRRHYMKMHPDPKPVFWAHQIKCVKWIAETAEQLTASPTERKQGRFVEGAESAKTSFYEFEDATHRYSASMYLVHDVSAPPYFEQRSFTPEVKASLIEFLRSQDLPDTFYALEGPQPDDAVGVPLEVLLTSTDCAVCGEKATDINYVFGNLTENCTHDWTAIMCKECLNGYMTSKIAVENGAVNGRIVCWAEGCLEILSHHEVQKYSDPEAFEAYDHALLQQTIHGSEAFANCSTPECKGGGWLESDDVSYFQCYLCNRETCVSHNGPRDDHRGKPCPATPAGQLYAAEEAREEAERQAAIAAKTAAEEEAKRKAKEEADRLARERREGLKATERLLKQISKKCPTCKVPIEKNEGCDHMTCRTKNGRGGCGAEFCWECSAPYGRIRAEGNSAHATTCPYHA